MSLLAGHSAFELSDQHKNVGADAIDACNLLHGTGCSKMSWCAESSKVDHNDSRLFALPASACQWTQNSAQIFLTHVLYGHAQEQEMQTLHDAHIKEMTKLRYELEQARTEGHCPCIFCPEYVHACNIHVAQSDDCISGGL